MNLPELPDEPTRVGPYRIERLIGSGGMGIVYAARHEGSSELVALKVMDRSRATDAVAIERFLREGRLMAQVRHPHVVQVWEVGIASRRPFIAMELLEGETLAAVLAREGPMPVQRMASVFSPLLSAVSAIHAAGITHRDLKLANVMLARRAGGNAEPVLLDFGVSKSESSSDDSSLTHSLALVGTLRYLSPEQMLNARAASARSDQYALGVMLYECTTGQRAFAASSQYELMDAILNARVKPIGEQVAGLPPGFDALVQRAMNRHPAERFPSVRALGDALLQHADATTWARWAREFCGEDSRSAADVTEHDGRARESHKAPVFAFTKPEAGLASSTATRRVRKARLAAATIAGGAALIGTFSAVMTAADVTVMSAGVVRLGALVVRVPKTVTTISPASEHVAAVSPPIAPVSSARVTPARKKKPSKAARLEQTLALEPAPAAATEPASAPTPAAPESVELDPLADPH